MKAVFPSKKAFMALLMSAVDFVYEVLGKECHKEPTETEKVKKSQANSTTQPE